MMEDRTLLGPGVCKEKNVIRPAQYEGFICFKEENYRYPRQCFETVFAMLQQLDVASSVIPSGIGHGNDIV
jgi:hypothetical protein